MAQPKFEGSGKGVDETPKSGISVAKQPTKEDLKKAEIQFQLGE